MKIPTNSPIAESAESFVRWLLTNELKAGLTFHNLQHTLGVIDAVSQLSEFERCSDAEKEIVKLAATFHDTGFVRVYKLHEEESIHIANTFLLKGKYPGDRLYQILTCIAATKQGAEAHCKVEMILQDADMAHLARDDYFTLLNDLRQELMLFLDQIYGDRDWFGQNLDFLMTHSYKTDSAKLLWDEKKAKNIEQNRQLLSFL